MTTPYKIMVITSWIVVCMLVNRVNLLEHNIKAIKEWLKICGVIDIDKITDEFREWKESEGE